MVIFAKSGSGKSYTVKLEILRSLMMGTECIVIDPKMNSKHYPRQLEVHFLKLL